MGIYELPRGEIPLGRGAVTCLMFVGKVYKRWNLLLRAWGDGSTAPSPGSQRAQTVDGGPVPLAPTAAHDPVGIPKALWARRSSIGATETIGMNI